MRLLPYLLVLLLTLALVDDTWAGTPDLPSAPLTDDNDEYLTTWPPSRGGTSSPRHGLPAHGLHPRTAEPFSGRESVLSEGRTAPFVSALLYVFMSLQI
jgi:hypothetical protein